MGQLMPVFPVPGTQQTFMPNEEANDTVHLRLVPSWQGADVKHGPFFLDPAPHVLLHPGCLGG